jgi:hypothetical protein
MNGGGGVDKSRKQEAVPSLRWLSSMSLKLENGSKQRNVCFWFVIRYLTRRESIGLLCKPVIICLWFITFVGQSSRSRCKSALAAAAQKVQPTRS